MNKKIGEVIGFVAYIAWRMWFSCHTKEWQSNYIKNYRLDKS